MATILPGRLIAMVGPAEISAYPRFTFGSIHLVEGARFLPLALGLFG